MKKQLLTTLMVSLVALGATACSSDENNTEDLATEQTQDGRAIEGGDTDEGMVLDETVPAVGEETGGHDPDGENAPVDRPMAGEDAEAGTPE